MTNAVDSLNVENNVEESRCATALASHAGIPGPLVLRFEECGGTLPPDGSLWREEYQGEAFTIRDGREPKLPRGSHLRTKACLELIHGALRLPPGSWGPGSSPRRGWLVGARQHSS